MAMDWSFLGGDTQGTDGQSLGWQANPDFLRLLGTMGAGFSQGKPAGEVIGGATNEALRMRALQGKNPQQLVTPKGQPGPDSITTKQTADGVTTTIQTPSEANLNTYGTSVPPESIKASTMGGSEVDQSPFWRALLGMK